MTNTQPVTLYSYRSQELLSLSDAISVCSTILEGAIALLYSPNACSFLRLIGGEFEDANEEGRKPPNSFNDVFEARIFTPDYELRWLNRDMKKGDAVLLTQTPQSIDGFQEAKQPIKDTLDQQYLLWGEPVLNPKNIQDGWQRLAEARIGKLDIPLSEKLKDKKQRVYLKTREYIVETLEYGNCTVIEERLVKLEVVSQCQISLGKSALA